MSTPESHPGLHIISKPGVIRAFRADSPDEGSLVHETGDCLHDALIRMLEEADEEYEDAA